jgi:DNA-binding TFAR19-related protein (PDSD5 family)
MRAKKKTTSRKAVAKTPTADQASQVVKKLAAKQKIAIRLTEEQLNEIIQQWNDKDPRSPAEISFHVGPRKVIELKVAGYRYRGNTCCV